MTALKTDKFGCLWFQVKNGMSGLTLGSDFAVPVDGGTDWFVLGTITAGIVRADGSGIAYALSFSDHSRLIDPVDADKEWAT